LRGQDIQVSAEEGKVVLRGSVESDAQKQQIEDRVQNIILDNQIRVQGEVQGQQQQQQQPGVQTQP
ncbi:MAG: BON domain-containing protein, partial [Limisphaerales bacterium]